MREGLALPGFSAGGALVFSGTIATTASAFTPGPQATRRMTGRVRFMLRILPGVRLWIPSGAARRSRFAVGTTAVGGALPSRHGGSKRRGIPDRNRISFRRRTAVAEPRAATAAGFRQNIRPQRRDGRHEDADSTDCASIARQRLRETDRVQTTGRGDSRRRRSGHADPDDRPHAAPISVRLSQFRFPSLRRTTGKENG